MACGARGPTPMPMSTLHDIQTPALVLDRDRVDANIARLTRASERLGVPLRPHGKTPKSVAIARRMMEAGAAGLTVSTLLEAERYFDGGITDLFYAVALAPSKAARAARLIAKGADLVCQVDHPAALETIAQAAQAESVVMPLAIEIDVDGHRTGAAPDGDLFGEIVRGIAERPALRLHGIMSYGGASYEIGAEARSDLAERHRAALEDTAAALRADGHGIAMVSFGSTPAILAARSMQGVTELRCGTHVFQDLFQAAIHACPVSDIALTVLTEVISHRPGDNALVLDAGGLAMSKDRATAATDHDAGYGLLTPVHGGPPIEGLFIAETSQELGVARLRGGAAMDFGRFPVGSRLRVLPNHCDTTAAAGYGGYQVVAGGTDVIETWDRFDGW